MIDYVLVEDHFLQNKLCEFNVGDFNLHSDHAPIYLTLKTNTKTDYSIDDSIDHTRTLKSTKISWDLNKIDEIRQHLSQCAPNIRSSLESIDESPDGINNTVKAFTNVIMEIFKPFCEKEITYSHKAVQI